MFKIVILVPRKGLSTPTFEIEIFRLIKKNLTPELIHVLIIAYAISDGS